ncbi:MAG: DUF6514 family protein [Candidatus Fimenecus sp.]
MVYSVFKHKVKLEDKTIESCGINVCDENGSTVRTVWDVSCSFSAVSSLVDSLNRGEVDPVHLDSILEDFYFHNC